MAPGVRPSAVSIFRCAPNPREPPGQRTSPSQEERDSQSPSIRSRGHGIADNLTNRAHPRAPSSAARGARRPAHLPPIV